MPKVIEMCCGYGGATAGMMSAGLEIEKSYDIWKIAVDAHKAWHTNAPCETRDVRPIEPEELAGRIVWASLPCQPWSTANRTKNRGMVHPHYYSLAHWAHQVQFAEFAVLENVPGLVSEKDGQQEIRALESACAKLGLSLSINVIPSHWFGVPQIRRRVIILVNAPMVLFTPKKTSAFKQMGSAIRATFGGGTDSNQYVKRAPCASERDTRTSTNPDTGEVNFVGRTARECAEIQGVPYEPIAHLAKSHQYTLIGNAVPPKLAHGVMSAVLRGF